MKNPGIACLQNESYWSKTYAELHYIIKDAAEAALAMRDFDYEAECKYLDQVNDAVTVLNHRSNNWR